MPSSDIVNEVKEVANKAAVTAEEYSGVLSSAKGWIVDNFGPQGVIVAYLALTVITLLIVSKIAKLSFATLKYLVVPSVGLAFLATLFLPYSFVAALPVTVTLCSLLLLFKG